MLLNEQISEISGQVRTLSYVSFVHSSRNLDLDLYLLEICLGLNSLSLLDLGPVL